MTVFTRPGVYIDETLTPIAQAVSAPGASVAAFVGTIKQGGPITPTLVNSFAQYVSTFGGFGDASDAVPFAVYEYFNNGGTGAYIVRAVASDAVASNTTLMDTEGTPAATLKITAISPGTWGNQIYVDIVANAAGTGRWDLVVYVGGSTAAFVRERFTGLSLNPSDSRNALTLVNSPQIGSAFIRISSLLTSAWVATHEPAVQAAVALASGADGAAAVNLATAAQRLETVQQNLVVNLPGVNDSTTINALATWAQGLGTVFIVVDGIRAQSTDNAASYASSLVGMTSGGSALSSSSYLAVYAPWLVANDPATSTNGSARLLPPGGAVMGQYARTDVTRGVQKPPAGIDTALRGVLDVQFTFSNTDQGTLNAAGINVIKADPGTGFVINGARTLSQGLPDRYVSIRRSLMLIKQGLLAATKFAVFEPNDQILWDHISAVVSQYLMTLMQVGVLAGSTPDQSFFVVCDSTNNTGASVANGVVNLQVGVALSAPAEFIVISIGQFSGGSTVTETAA